MTEVSFGEWLKRQRNGRGLTQKEMAHQIGCAVITLRKIESEERHPSAQIVERLAVILDIPENERTAFQRFARGDWRSAPNESIGDAPWRTSSSSSYSTIPSPLTSLIGRERELAKLSEYLSNPSVRLITLTGPPGTGKTRLSLQVAREALPDFSNNVFFVPLAPLEDASLVAPIVAQTLGFMEMPDQSPLEQLKNGIGDRHLLIVLDNAEHLIEETANLVSDLLIVCPRLKILATSREALRVRGEWLFSVSPLKIPETITSINNLETISQFSAITLFTERARAVQHDFKLNVKNIQSVAKICTRLDGLPLAIELIAAHIRYTSPGSLLSQFDDFFFLSADGMRMMSPRQKSLYNAIDWSYDFLSDKERILFHRLAAFAGSWTLDEAQTVCSGEGVKKDEIPSLLIHLVDKSLVIVQRHKRGERYQFLETIRHYAQGKLIELQEAEQMCNRHLDFFMKLAEVAESKLHGAEQILWLERLEAEQDNFRTALRWGLENGAEGGFRLVSALWLFWFMHAHYIEGRQWYEEALSVSEKATPLIRTRLLIGAASNAMGRGDFERTEALSKQGLTLAREQENEWGIAMSLHHLGIAAIDQGDYKQAKSLLEEGLALSRKAGNWAVSNYLLGDFSFLAISQGNYKQARLHAEEALALAQEHKGSWMISFYLQDLALIAYRQSDYSQAKALLEQALTLGYEFGDKRLFSSILETLGLIAFHQGSPERAARLISAVEAFAKSVGVAFPLEEPDTMVSMRERLGDSKFEALAAEGRAMTIEQAVMYVLEKQSG